MARTTLLKGTEKWPKPKLEIYGSTRWGWQPVVGEAVLDKA